jgi:hypothetical protein
MPPAINRFASLIRRHFIGYRKRRGTLKARALQFLLGSFIVGQCALDAGAQAMTLPGAAVPAKIEKLPPVSPVAPSPLRHPDLVVAAGMTLQVSFAHGLDATSFGNAVHSEPVLLSYASTPGDGLFTQLATPDATCKIVADGYATRSLARPLIYANGISCFDGAGNLLAQGVLQGYLVGADGILGMPNVGSLKTGAKATVVVTRSGVLYKMR